MKTCRHIKCVFQHIPREANTWADRLCHVASERNGDGIVNLPHITTKNEPVTVLGDLVAYKGHTEEAGEGICWKCK